MKHYFHSAHFSPRQHQIIHRADMKSPGLFYLFSSGCVPCVVSCCSIFRNFCAVQFFLLFYVETYKMMMMLRGGVLWVSAAAMGKYLRPCQSHYTEQGEGGRGFSEALSLPANLVLVVVAFSLTDALLRKVNLIKMF